MPVGKAHQNNRITQRRPILTMADAIEIWRRHDLGEGVLQIAAGFRIEPQIVCETLNGRRFPKARVLSRI